MPSLIVKPDTLENILFHKAVYPPWRVIETIQPKLIGPTKIFLHRNNPGTSHLSLLNLSVCRFLFFSVCRFQFLSTTMYFLVFKYLLKDCWWLCKPVMRWWQQFDHKNSLCFIVHLKFSPLCFTSIKPVMMIDLNIYWRSLLCTNCCFLCWIFVTSPDNTSCFPLSYGWTLFVGFVGFSNYTLNRVVFDVTCFEVVDPGLLDDFSPCCCKGQHSSESIPLLETNILILVLLYTLSQLSYFWLVSDILVEVYLGVQKHTLHYV